ncbi:MAG: hydrolase [Magnetospirillum sp.]|nr:hydrolase [Magnetospirillum sp.]
MDHERERMGMVAEAVSWFRTPYRDCQRLKGCGVDCAQYPAAAYHAAGLVEEIPHFPYSPQWHINQREEKYLKVVLSYAREIAPPGCATWPDDLVGPRGVLGDEVVDALIKAGTYAPLPGDLVLYKVGHCHAHGAIVIAWPRIIHAVKGEGVKYGQGLEEPFHKDRLADRLPRFFTVF